MPRELLPPAAALWLGAALLLLAGCQRGKQDAATVEQLQAARDPRAAVQIPVTCTDVSDVCARAYADCTPPLASISSRRRTPRRARRCGPAPSRISASRSRTRRKGMTGSWRRGGLPRQPASRVTIAPTMRAMRAISTDCRTS